MTHGTPVRGEIGPRGRYRDLVIGPDDTIAWDSGWRSNVIVANCHRLLASLLRGEPATQGITGMQFGAGDPGWDATGAPQPTPAVTSLVDGAPFTLPAASLVIDYLSNNVVSATPTDKLQVVANLPPGQPPWPDATHATSVLREFAVVGALVGDPNPLLINCVRHPAIVKDAASSLKRTVWLFL